MKKLAGIITLLAAIVIAGGIWAAISLGNNPKEPKTNISVVKTKEETPTKTTDITEADSVAEAFDAFLQTEGKDLLLSADELSIISNDDDILGSTEQPYDI